jgi:hypothetical protein
LHQSHAKKATYSNEGILLVLETQLTSLVQVPKTIANKIMEGYKQYIVDGIWKSETANETNFHLQLRKDERIITLTFLPTGKLKSKVKHTR